MKPRKCSKCGVPVDRPGYCKTCSAAYQRSQRQRRRRHHAHMRCRFHGIEITPKRVDRNPEAWCALCVAEVESISERIEGSLVLGIADLDPSHYDPSVPMESLRAAIRDRWPLSHIAADGSVIRFPQPSETGFDHDARSFVPRTTRDEARGRMQLRTEYALFGDYVWREEMFAALGRLR